MNGARLGFARNRKTGRVTRFTLRCVGIAMRIAWELANERDRERER